MKKITRFRNQTLQIRSLRILDKAPGNQHMSPGHADKFRIPKGKDQGTWKNHDGFNTKTMETGNIPVSQGYPKYKLTPQEHTE
jgi:hypothetical protein